MNDTGIDLGYGISVVATIGGAILAILAAGALFWLVSTYMQWFKSRGLEDKLWASQHLPFQMLLQKIQPDMPRGLKMGLLALKLVCFPFLLLLAYALLILAVGAIVTHVETGR